MNNNKITRRGKLIRITLIALVIGASWLYEKYTGNPPSNLDSSALSLAISDQASDVQVQGSGTVIKLLPEDTQGSRHQRFLVKLEDGHVILIAHNIDLAPRIDTLDQGDSISFYGEFEWNDKGGVVHWTHRDPGNRHPHGWLEHNGERYQ